MCLPATRGPSKAGRQALRTAKINKGITKQTKRFVEPIIILCGPLRLCVFAVKFRRMHFQILSDLNRQQPLHFLHQLFPDKVDLLIHIHAGLKCFELSQGFTKERLMGTGLRVEGPVSKRCTQ